MKKETAHVLKTDTLAGTITLIFYSDYSRIISEIPEGSVVEISLIEKR